MLRAMTIEGATLILCCISGAVGLLATAASVFNLEWFFRSGNARALTGRMGRRSARLFYFVVGVAITAMTVYMITTLCI